MSTEPWITLAISVCTYTVYSEKYGDEKCNIMEMLHLHIKDKVLKCFWGLWVCTVKSNLQPLVWNNEIFISGPSRKRRFLISICCLWVFLTEIMTVAEPVGTSHKHMLMLEISGLAAKNHHIDHSSHYSPFVWSETYCLGVVKAAV